MGDQRGIADQLTNLASAEAQLENFEAALELNKSALTVAREIQDSRREGRALNNLGVTHLDMGELDEAIRVYNEAMTHWRAIGETRNLGYVAFNIGEVLQKQGHLDLARARYDESLRYSQEAGDQFSIFKTNWQGMTRFLFRCNFRPERMLFRNRLNSLCGGVGF